MVVHLLMVYLSLDKNNEEVGIEGSKKIINNNFNSNLTDELDRINLMMI